jgi:glycine/D-amino acid oxidase-like deaminating enzyme
MLMSMHSTGHGPWGVALSTGTGKVLSELIMDGEASSADIQALCPTRFF